MRLEMIARGADAIEARFAGDEFEEDPAVTAAATGGDHLEVSDREWGQSVRIADRLLLCRRRNHRSGEEEFPKGA